MNPDGDTAKPKFRGWILVLVLVLVVVLDQPAFYPVKRPIVPQLFCPVSLIVKHRDSWTKDETSTRTSPQFRFSG